MTLNDLASRVDSDVGNLSRIERGVQMPSKELAEKICRVLGSGLTEMHLFYPERYPDDASLQSADLPEQPPCNLPDDAKVRESKGGVRQVPDAGKLMS